MHRGRFAPTPSGHLHMGSLVCALASFLDVKKRGGEWFVRIEDVDGDRCRPDFEHAILNELVRHGLQWDGAVVRQSERQDLYLDCLSDLGARGLLFQCFCSRASLRAAGCPENPQGEFIYSGLCRAGTGVQWGNSHALRSSVRFAIGCGHYQFEDMVHGAVRGDVSLEVGDFIVKRADGFFAYHLAVVVDDYHQGITRVVRGDDILPLTGRQLLLQRALNFDSPTYGHLPLVTDSEGRKLSKSASARALRQSHECMNLVEALAHLGIQARSSDFHSAEELIKFALGEYKLT